MLNNLILIFIALIVLCFIGTLWLRHDLMEKLRQLQRQTEILKKDYDRRRDQVPLLLESVKAVQEPSDAWRKLLKDRGAFQGAPGQSSTVDLAAEMAFEKSLQEFIATSSLRSLDFLEVKKSIEDISALIQKERDALQSAMIDFNLQRKVFPYNWAAALFGFHELT